MKTILRRRVGLTWGKIIRSYSLLSFGAVYKALQV